MAGCCTLGRQDLIRFCRAGPLLPPPWEPRLSHILFGNCKGLASPPHFLKTESLTETGSHQVSKTSWLTSPKDHPVCPLPRLRCRCTPSCLTFHTGLGDMNSGPQLVWQSLHQQVHLPGPGDRVLRQSIKLQ